MAKGLTERQRKVLEYIIDFQKENGFPPTIRELGDYFQIGSLRGVTVHLDALVRKGFMTRDRSSRSIRITGGDPRLRTNAATPPAPTGATGARLPLVRGLNGGRALVNAAHVEQYILVPHEVAVPATRAGFVIRVGGSGVAGEPILSGDLVVVRPQTDVPENDLAVFL